MPIGLSEKGECVVSQDCEEGFCRVDFDLLDRLADELGFTQTSGRLKNHFDMLAYSPEHGLIGSNDRGAFTDIQALLFYESLDRPGGVPLQFGNKCRSLLESYLIEREYLDEDSWEDDF